MLVMLALRWHFAKLEYVWIIAPDLDIIRVVIIVDLFMVKISLFTNFIANYFFILVIILESYDMIYKQK